jgi:hypothetical protein
MRACGAYQEVCAVVGIGFKRDLRFQINLPRRFDEQRDDRAIALHITGRRLCFDQRAYERHQLAFAPCEIFMQRGGDPLVQFDGHIVSYY